MQIVTTLNSSSYYHKNIDAYVVASEYSQDALIEMGVECIYTYGIPVKKSFTVLSIKDAFANKPLHPFIMGGSMGLSAIGSVIREIIKGKVGHHLILTVVCRRNKDFTTILPKNIRKIFVQVK